MIATFITLAANLVPLIGVWSWGWDPFQVLILYWAETVIIGGWALARIATLPPQYLGTITINGREQRGTNRTMTTFFASNAGGFVFVHLFFLCALFFRDWPSEVRGPISFVTTYFGNAGVWAVLFLAFIAGLVAFVTATPRPVIVENVFRSLNPQRFVPQQPEPGDAVDLTGGIIADLYKRILVMQAAIIAGAMFAQSYGIKAPLLIVIVLKTLFDLNSKGGGASMPVTFSNGGTKVTTDSKKQ